VDEIWGEGAFRAEGGLILRVKGNKKNQKKSKEKKKKKKKKVGVGSRNKIP